MEVNMEQICTKSPPVDRTLLKKTIQLKARKCDVDSLKSLGRMLKKPQQMTLRRRYGKILSLLEVDVQVEALTALAQYYDPPLRCFTFTDFQLAPTLEEYGQILDLPFATDSKPYRYSGHVASLQTIAKVLKISVRELQSKRWSRNETEGYSRKYLEDHMRSLAETQDWDTFIDVLALVIYGILLFPSSFEDVVDFPAIDVFLALKCRGENPVPALLADTYSTLNFCHEKKGNRILCCLPVLYVWITGHIFKRSSAEFCPIADCRMLKLKSRNSREWVSEFTRLTEAEIRWYPRWEQKETLIFKCGDFPNVPLMGPRGCINYNPILTSRQLAYPILGAPPESMVSGFWIYYKDEAVTPMIRRVSEAWNNVIWKGRELGVRSVGVNEEYYQWVKSRAREVKLPFSIPTDIPNSSASKNFPIPIPLENTEVEGMKVNIEKLERGKGDMEKRLDTLRRAYQDLEEENVELKRKSTAEGISQTKRLKAEKQQLQKEVNSVRDCLKATNKEFRTQGQELEKVIFQNKQLKGQLGDARKAHEEASQMMSEMSERLENLVISYESAKESERESVRRLRTQLAQQNVDIERWIQDFHDQYKEARYWKNRFANLAEMANTAIVIIPQYLLAAEELVDPIRTPAEIKGFIQLCKDMVQEMKEMAANRD